MTPDTSAPSATPDAGAPPQTTEPKGAKKKPGADREPQGDYADEAKVRLLLDRCIQDAIHNRPRLMRDRQDIHNLMFYRGGEANHWSIFNKTTEAFEERPTSGQQGLPAWIKRCTTNKFAKKIDGVAAILNQSAAAKSFSPSTDDDVDRATAEVCEDADPVLLDEIGYDALKRRVNQLVTLTDKVAVVYWFDNDEKYGTASVELLQCQDCQEFTSPMEASVDADADPAAAAPDDSGFSMGETDDSSLPCPACGSPNLAVAQDPSTGQAIGLDYPRGKLCADLYTSYEFSLPSSAKVADAKKNPWVLGHSELPITEVCSTWKEKARDIKKQQSLQPKVPAMTRQYAEQMRVLNSPFAAWVGRRSEQEKGTVTVYRLQHDPIEDDELSFPQGLHAVMVGDVIVEAGPLPLQDANGYYQKSIIIRQFADTPNTPFGKPVADDLLPIQQQRNLRETIIYITDMFHALPTVFLPAGVELIDEWLNQPGQMIRFRSTDPSAKPIIQNGLSAPEGLYKSIEACDAALDEISGLNAVLQGERPAGDPTLGEVNMLAERGMAAFRTPLDHQITFEREQSLLLLNLARTTLWAPRFRKVEGETGGWKITQFTAADLSGRVDIQIDPLSAWPKSPSMQLVKLQKGIELGVVQPAQDPEVATKVLQMLDLMHLKPSLNEDVDQVSRMLDRWKRAQTGADIQPPDMATINPKIHLFLVQQFVKTEPFEQLRQEKPDVAQGIVSYIQALQQALAPPPMPAPPQGEQRPDGSAVHAAVAAGALRPAGGKPTSPLAGLVKSGALQPADAAGAAKEAASRASGASVDALLHAGAIRPAGPPGGPAAAPPGGAH